MRMLSLLAAVLVASSAAGETVVPVGAFQSIELRNGGHVIVRHGEKHRVTIVTGDARYTSIRVAGGNQLVIDKCEGDCPHRYRVDVEVVTPELSAVSVSNGGMLIVGAFPSQQKIEAHVEQGGTIDIRAIAADAVDASVYSGGRILTRPRQSLVASVDSGGAITYWGDARVEKSVRHGGVVQRGSRADETRPLSELDPNLAPVPPLPPVPPVPER